MSNTSLDRAARMPLWKRASGFASAATLMLLSVGSSAAETKPTEAEVTKARADCAAHKQRVRTLEAKVGPDDPKVAEERSAWERACAKAQSLINAAEGKSPPQPSTPPP